MNKIIILGNSGSGKSTLAKSLVAQKGLAHLDLDTLAWLPESPPQRAPLDNAKQEISAFVEQNDGFVIEGCYSDLLEISAPFADKVIFMNLSIEDCIANAKNRPWEPHKYESKEAQDKNLEMLIEWIKQYTQRKDEFSYSSHKSFYDNFAGEKVMYTENISHH